MSKTVLVTGASRGIGQHIALQLGAKGFDIVVHYNSDRDAAEAVAESVRQSGVNARPLQFDCGDREQCAAVIADDMANYGTYYGVVCNAGIHKDNAFPGMSGEEWDSVLRTNLDGFYNVLHPVIMPMVRARNGGRIVVMSSVSGIMGNRGQVNYSASKGGLIAASKALAVELAKRRITVNCVAPGLIETEMTEAIDADLVRDIVPARRMGRPEEVASLVAYLFSPDAEYITRQVISVNGGMI
ncbi:MAG: 3-oxoacyl-ACP reductase FabG [Rhodospirillaceae bacterium]|jgi:3-oxoacyl-[acyl-carrier protein] reductase|nr:3-oxoacyl-ACP reductase FabG [Rhodospirillaceae bacterium]MBT5038683.1 3-oxoacyl-ACP reductase FabG [Rhodospirillaceae bacterium]MBT5674164.1 3-oxoacyl-ACP reductase FabG [Rhodospirillaceae bacterium]MBT5780830.1 3-oxoacyl-ACP reductase FabG [Rhodospirillaceae bacterium]MBT6830628.1 3-oxoacyl-ACP reductase FabG [Rhodospirillaceae bacterium]